MKDELKIKLVEILSSIQSVAGKAGDFAMEQLPDIAQSYVFYGRASATAYFFLALLTVLAAAVSIYWGLRQPLSSLEKYGSSNEFYRTDSATGAIIGGCVALAAGVVAVLIQISGVMLVWFAPKVWLLKEIAQLVR
jgi:hypothetical protein